MKRVEGMREDEEGYDRTRKVDSMSASLQRMLSYTFSRHFIGVSDVPSYFAVLHHPDTDFGAQEQELKIGGPPLSCLKLRLCC